VAKRNAEKGENKIMIMNTNQMQMGTVIDFGDWGSVDYEPSDKVVDYTKGKLGSWGMDWLFKDDNPEGAGGLDKKWLIIGGSVVGGIVLLMLVSRMGGGRRVFAGPAPRRRPRRRRRRVAAQVPRAINYV